MKIALSVGHSEKVRGMRGSPVPPQCDEVDECLKICTSVSELLERNGVECPMFFDTTSNSQSQYLTAQANWTNQQHADLAVQCHLNASQNTSGKMGCEVWYYSQEALARKVATAMASALNLPDRGPKFSSSLSFLVNTDPPAILLECFFGDATGDCESYRAGYDALITAIAGSISGADIGDTEPPPVEQPPAIEPPELTDKNWVDIRGAATGRVQCLINGVTVYGEHHQHGPVVDLFMKLHGDVTVVLNGEAFHNKPPEQPSEPLLHVSGPCSWFGGPQDTGVAPDEGLAFIYSYDYRPDLFLPQQPPGTTGLARRLNPDVFYVACRWDYNKTPKTMLDDKSIQARVRANGREFLAWPADWGPHEDTGRVADLSKGLMDALGINTDDNVEVDYPASAEGVV